MPSVTFNLTSEHITRLINAFCGLHDYDSMSEQTGETKQEFSLRILRGWLVSQVRRWEQSEAQKAAAAVVTDIEVTE